MASRVGSGIALPFLEHGIRRGWVVNSTSQSQFTPGKDLVPIVQEAGWAPGPVWMAGKFCPTGIRSPGRPARSSVAIPTELRGTVKMIRSKGKVLPLQAEMASSVGSGIALPLLDHGIRSGWVVNSTTQPQFTPGKDPVPIVQEAGWPRRVSLDSGKSRSTWIRSPDLPARSQSLYRLSYLSHGLHVKYSLLLSEFSRTWIVRTDLRKTLRYQISWKFFQWEQSCRMRTDRRMWRS
jgi:hypothetical protein